MEAFGSPGAETSWTSGAKDAVTTSRGTGRVWATVGQGVVNEVYWPAVDQPQVRDIGFIVANDDGRWTEVKTGAYLVDYPSPHVPLPVVVRDRGDFTLRLEVFTDPSRDSLLIDYALEGAGWTAYVLVAPHLG